MKNIAIVCDYDDTLTDNSTTGYLSYLGIDVKEFWNETDRMIAEFGYDHTMSYLTKFMNHPLVNKNTMIEYGKTIKFYDGVYTLVKNLKQDNPNVNLEFYIISAGIDYIIKSSKIAKLFNGVYTIELDYDSSGKPLYIKKIITPSEKIRYLYAIKKGISNPDLSIDDSKFNFEDICYIGDGLSDVGCWSVVKEKDGLSIAVDKSDEYFKSVFIKDKRVDHLYSTNYTTQSDIYKNINGWIKSKI